MASFFYFAGVTDTENEIIDVLAARYGWTVPDIFAMAPLMLWQIYEKALKERQRDRIRDQWIALLPFMSMEMLQFMSFEDYYDQVTGRNLDLRPAAVILAEVEELKKELGVQ